MISWEYVDHALGELQGFQKPTGIAVDGQDRVIVADCYSRLQVYAKEKQYTPTYL